MRAHSKTQSIEGGYLVAPKKVRFQKREEANIIWVYNRISQIPFSKTWRKGSRCVCQGIKSSQILNKTKIWRICRRLTESGKNRWR
jgi:hypothetical protein